MHHDCASGRLFIHFPINSILKIPGKCKSAGEVNFFRIGVSLEIFIAHGPKEFSQEDSALNRWIIIKYTFTSFKLCEYIRNVGTAVLHLLVAYKTLHSLHHSLEVRSL